MDKDTPLTSGYFYQPPLLFIFRHNDHNFVERREIGSS